MILDDEQRRAMTFIAAVNRGGYRPTGREINEWRRRPERKPRRRGALLEPEVPAVPDRRVAKRRPGGLAGSWSGVQSTAARRALTDTYKSHATIANILRTLGRVEPSTWQALAGVRPGAMGLFDSFEWETIPGKPGHPAVYAPDKPAEKFLAHLRRLGWVERDSRRRYRVTQLGHALLAVDAMAGSDDVDPSVVVLAPEDQKLGYGQVMGRISTCGDAVVADHYLGVEELIDLLEHTDASRFIVGPNLGRERVTELSLQIQLAPPSAVGMTRELRTAPLHDRYVVGDHSVYTLTASLNGISKSSMAVLMEMPPVAADAIRTHVEALWSSATPLARGLSPEEMEAEVEAEGDATGAGQKHITVDEDGRFVHEGCEVRHKKRDAAENCTHGAV